MPVHRLLCILSFIKKERGFQSAPPDQICTLKPMVKNHVYCIRVQAYKATCFYLTAGNTFVLRAKKACFCSMITACGAYGIQVVNRNGLRSPVTDAVIRDAGASTACFLIFYCPISITSSLSYVIPWMGAWIWTKQATRRLWKVLSAGDTG